MCFLPLLPWCVRRRDELAALVLAGCVGIGLRHGGEHQLHRGHASASATLARLLMPAPLHMAMTGLVGLAAYRACVWPQEWGPQFVAMFGVVVLAHGLYDAFIAPAGAARTTRSVGMLIFVVARSTSSSASCGRKQELRVEPMSLTANFLFCVSTVAAATFVYLCARGRLAGGGRRAGRRHRRRRR